jgi:hypothetical protein
LSWPALVDERFEELRTIRQLVDEHQWPSLVGAVAKDGRIVSEEGFGWPDREQRIAARRARLTCWRRSPSHSPQQPG